MKTIYFSFLLLLSFSITQAQWTNQNPVADGNDLWSTFFVDDNTGWIVGSNGFIKKTTNAGVDWIEQISGTILTLKSIQFVNQNTGWICGERGLILKTTDGGTNWDSLVSGTTEHLSDIDFCDVNTGYVVGFGGTILKTIDGGLSWAGLSSGTTNDLYSLDFVDTFIGYAAGKVTDTSSVIKTTDGGVSWVDKSSGFPATNGNCLSIEFVNAEVGFVGCYGSLLKTSDGGETWNQTQSPLTLGHTGRKQLILYPSGAGIKSIYFKDVNNGWYLSWSGFDNYIYRTTNCGIDWEPELNRGDWEHSLLSVFVTQNGTGLAVGAYGMIYSKAESDSVWSRLFSGRNDEINSIYFVNENIGWAGAYRYGNPYKSVILKTSNGGKIWKTVREVLGADHKISFYFINELTGWAVLGNESHMVEAGGGILQTTDGGKNWITVNSIGHFSSLFFINKDTCFVTGDKTSSGIYKSTDGGISLEQKSSISVSNIYFLDINNGWAVGAGGILKSTDGGETWISQSSLTGSQVIFFNANIGMCAGGGDILVSTDAGETWASKSGPLLQSINFINSTTVWGYTSEGTVYKTTDFGDTWSSLNAGLGYGNTSFFINEYTGWVGGQNFIFKNSTEPLLSLHSPNGGEIWKSSSERNITWSSENISSINLYYSTNGGSNWNIIASNVDASSGSYNWSIPNLTWFLNLNCKVKIEDASNSSVYDGSDNNFIIWHFCNIIQYANLGQRIIDFLETDIDISLNVTTADNISVNYYPFEKPAGGSLPSGVVVLSDYYWQISSPAISFSNGKMIAPISALRGVVDPSKLVWLKRSNLGDPWENIGGTVVGENLESTVLFNSFSEFAIGSTDPANPLPVELSSFTALSKSDQIILKWETKTETNNYGFDIEKKTNDTWQKIGFVDGNGNSGSPKEYSFTDNKLIGATKFQYRLKQIDNDGKYEYSAVVEVNVVPTEYALYQNYPNPFNPTTTIRYQLPKESKVVIKIYNILGSEVMDLVNEQKVAGIYVAEFNAETLSSGTYIYRIIADSFIETKKMILIK
jgi:photosystem II stability/assembly factor-like uncharacterized protein